MEPTSQCGRSPPTLTELLADCRSINNNFDVPPGMMRKFLELAPDARSDVLRKLAARADTYKETRWVIREWYKLDVEGESEEPEDRLDGCMTLAYNLLHSGVLDSHVTSCLEKQDGSFSYGSCACNSCTLLTKLPLVRFLAGDYERDVDRENYPEDTLDELDGDLEIAIAEAYESFMALTKTDDRRVALRINEEVERSVIVSPESVESFILLSLLGEGDLHPHLSEKLELLYPGFTYAQIAREVCAFKPVTEGHPLRIRLSASLRRAVGHGTLATLCINDVNPVDRPLHHVICTGTNATLVFKFDETAPASVVKLCKQVSDEDVSGAGEALYTELSRLHKEGECKSIRATKFNSGACFSSFVFFVDRKL